MTKIFYWHLIELSPLKTKLINRGVEDSDLSEILDHVEEIIHHRTLSFIFDSLPPEHHHEFTSKLAINPQNGEIWNFLKQRSKRDLSGEIGENIREIISEIVNEFEFDKK